MITQSQTNKGFVIYIFKSNSTIIRIKRHIAAHLENYIQLFIWLYVYYFSRFTVDRLVFYFFTYTIIGNTKSHGFSVIQPKTRVKFGNQSQKSPFAFVNLLFLFVMILVSQTIYFLHVSPGPKKPIHVLLDNVKSYGLNTYTP